MALTYGFYDSVNNDRRYDARQFGSIFDGIIRDGIFQSIGDAFAVKSAGGNIITVGSGRAWFNGTWTLNDAIIPLSLSAADSALNRIDAVVLEIGTSAAIRTNSIKIIKSALAETPANPVMAKEGGIYQYPLAYIYRRAASASVVQADITNTIGTSAAPFVTGPLNVLSTDIFTDQWKSQWSVWFENFKSTSTSSDTTWMNSKKSEFEAWYATIQGLLNGDQAGNLAVAIAELRTDFDNSMNALKYDNQVETSTVIGTDMFMISRGGHYRKVHGQNLTWQVAQLQHDNSPLYGNKRNAVRGANLGDIITADQLANIRNGSFKNIWLGDYWLRNGIVWRIVDMDYWYGIGLPKFQQHHLVIMPDHPTDFRQTNYSPPGNAGWFYTDIRQKGYLDDSEAKARTVFPNAMLAHQEYMSIRVEQGMNVAGVWAETMLDIPNVYMIYGHGANTPKQNGNPAWYNMEHSSLQQFRLMNLEQQFINPSPTSSYWLKDLVSMNGVFLCVYPDSRVVGLYSSHVLGVRPVFAVG